MNLNLESRMDGFFPLPHHLLSHIPVFLLSEIPDKPRGLWCFVSIIKLDLTYNPNFCLVTMTVINQVRQAEPTSPFRTYGKTIEISNLLMLNSKKCYMQLYYGFLLHAVVLWLQTRDSWHLLWQSLLVLVTPRTGFRSVCPMKRRISSQFLPCLFILI